MISRAGHGERNSKDPQVTASGGLALRLPLLSGSCAPERCRCRAGRGRSACTRDLLQTDTRSTSYLYRRQQSVVLGFFKGMCTGICLSPSGTMLQVWVWASERGSGAGAGVFAHSQVLFLPQACEGRGLACSSCCWNVAWGVCAAVKCYLLGDGKR